MKHGLVVLLLGIVLGWLPAARAALLPCFHAPSASWDASHIVLVTEEEWEEGVPVMRVEESWKGDLLPGDRLRLPFLVPLAAKSSREIWQGWGRRQAPDGPTHVSGSRLVLFLRIKGPPKIEPLL